MSVIKVSLEKITPSMAEKWLNKNTSNRKLREGLVEKYAADMKSGRWTQCIDPIAWYDNDELADGQHRLFAVVESGKSQDFIVVRGVNKESGLNIDIGAIRTLLDNARISGEDMDLSHALLATSKAIENPKMAKRAGRSLSHAERLELVAKHREAARWAIANGPQARGLGNSLVWAAMARAWYHEEDKQRLESFGRVLQRGFSSGDEDSAGVAIRNYLQSLPNLTAVPWEELFLKVQNAIWYFMRRKRLMVIKRVEDERYPLPRSRK